MLKHQIPVIANTYMNNFIGNWETAGEWTQKTISCGAYREDEEDPVYYHSFFNGWTPTSSHFWDADEGDNSLFYPTLSFPVENAYQKMRVYVYGCDVWNNKRLFIQAPGYWPQFLPPTTWTSGWHLNHESLFKFAKTGKYFWDGYCDLEGVHHYCHEVPFYINQGSRDYFIWEILGRIAHLIGDMCTPAHVHNDVHALGDFYETTMNFEFATQWDHSDALLAGGFFDVNGKQDPLRYLIYTINQITAYFPSDDADGNRNYIVTHGFDYYHELQSFMSTHLNPPNRNHINVNEIANVCFVNSIRAVAGLLYWFALETDLLDNTSVINNFGGGFIKVDFNNCYSNYRIKA